jgi:hypothetical protein
MNSAVDLKETAKLVRATGQRLVAARVTVLILAAVVIASVFLPGALGRTGDILGFVGMAAAGVWVMLGLNAAKHGRRVREAAALATIGRSDLAEDRALAALETFCLLRPVTVGAAAVMARVRQNQGRHDDAARLAAFVLSRPEKPLTGGKRTIRLLLAEAHLSVGRLAEAAAALMPLYQPDPKGDPPDLDEALRLLSLQLRIDAKSGQWLFIHDGSTKSLPMIELMPTGEMARCTAILLAAAVEMKDDASAALLRRRVELVSDVAKLAEAEPELARYL